MTCEKVINTINYFRQSNAYAEITLFAFANSIKALMLYKNRKSRNINYIPALICIVDCSEC